MLGVGSASRSQLGPSAYTLRASRGAPTMGWSIAVPGALMLQPTTCTKIVFISTLMAFLAPCWAFSWWVRHAAFTTCLTWATLDSVAIVFPELEWLDLIYVCCCCNSTIGFVSVEVFFCHPMLLGMLEKGLICDILSLLWSDPLFDFKMFCCMKKQLCPMYHFLSFSLVLASLCQIFDALI